MEDENYTEGPKLSDYLDKKIIKELIRELKKKGKPEYLKEEVKEYLEKISNIYNVQYKDLEKFYLDSINFDNLLYNKPLFDYKSFFKKLNINFEYQKEDPNIIEVKDNIEYSIKINDKLYSSNFKIKKEEQGLIIKTCFYYQDESNWIIYL